MTVHFVASKHREEGVLIWAVFSTDEAAKEYAELLDDLLEDDPRTYMTFSHEVADEAPEHRFEALEHHVERLLAGVPV